MPREKEVFVFTTREGGEEYKASCDEMKPGRMIFAKKLGEKKKRELPWQQVNYPAWKAREVDEKKDLECTRKKKSGALLIEVPGKKCEKQLKIKRTVTGDDREHGK